MENKHIKVSLIVPVYRVEKYIARCAGSLFRQTMKELEFVFVDDCSPDSSIRILEETLAGFPERKDSVKIIRNSQNLKQAASRRIGLEHASGDYVLYVDSDDWIEPDTAEILYAEAAEKDLDFVAYEFAVCRNGEDVRDVRFSRYTSRPQEYYKEYQHSPFWNIIWNKLFRRTLLAEQSVSLESIIWGEDFTLFFCLVPFERKFSVVQKVLYHYENGNENSVSFQLSLQRENEDTLKILQFIVRFYAEHHLLEKYRQEIHTLIFERKLSYLIREVWEPQKWREIFPETNGMWRTYPGLNPLTRFAILLVRLHLDFPARLLFSMRKKLRKQKSFE